MRLVNTLPLLLSLAAAIGSSAAWALPTDREQPIRVQADSAELDDKQGVAVYRGDVVAQGPLGEDTTYMVGGFYRYCKGFRHTGFRGDDGGQITASVTHKFDAGKLTVYGRYLDDTNAFYTPMPLLQQDGKFHTFPGFDARAARRALDRVWEDYAFAAARAEHAGHFNLLWSTRTLRRPLS